MTSKSLALITGFGGINSAGRSSSYLAYKNMVFDSLSSKEQLEVLQDLAVLQGKIEPIGRSWETNSGDSIDLKKYLLALRSLKAFFAFFPMISKYRIYNFTISSL